MKQEEPLTLRPASEVMSPGRLGASRITFLSFSRSMLRKVFREGWKIKRIQFDLDDQGYGEACYSIETDYGNYSFVVFSQHLDDQERSDRVIANKWDVTFALCEGSITEEKRGHLRDELPYQEAGRGDSLDLVWSRANRSTRVFDYVVNKLAKGEQPDPHILNQTGYLLRTTAVYGNGKYGIASYQKMGKEHPFYGAFRAQMFAVWMIREFSFELVEHIARARSTQAVCFDPKLKRFLGIGNATGLGMVPFLISHPKLLHTWIQLREVGIARVLHIQASKQDGQKLLGYIDRSIAYFRESPFVDQQVFAKPQEVVTELQTIRKVVEEFVDKGTINQQKELYPWRKLTLTAKKRIGIETQELLHSLLMELYPELLLDLEDQTTIEERYDLIPDMKIGGLKQVIQTRYDWVFQYDFSDPDENKYFWYRSKEKEEPRMGERGVEPGEEYELPVNIAQQVQQLNHILQNRPNTETVAQFVIRYPEYKWIVRRIQSLQYDEYAEIQGNLLSKGLIPVYLLRCKLAIFGAERFDPKSNRWVRITLFQGAPLVSDIGSDFDDQWFFPVISTVGG